MTINYTVRCCFKAANPEVPTRWLSWLRDEHIADVMNAGATSAVIVAMDPEPASGDAPTFEIRYTFPDRATFDTYTAEHAPGLREEGLSRFPLELGLNYSRTVGETTDSWASA